MLIESGEPVGKVEQIPPTCKNKKPCYRCGKNITDLVIVSTEIPSVGNVPRKVIWPKCALAGHKVTTSLWMPEEAQIRKLIG